MCNQVEVVVIKHELNTKSTNTKSDAFFPDWKMTSTIKAQSKGDRQWISNKH
jgi:hypothetical protein